MRKHHTQLRVGPLYDEEPDLMSMSYSSEHGRSGHIGLTTYKIDDGGSMSPIVEIGSVLQHEVL